MVSYAPEKFRESCLLSFVRAVWLFDSKKYGKRIHEVPCNWKYLLSKNSYPLFSFETVPSCLFPKFFVGWENVILCANIVLGRSEWRTKYHPVQVVYFMPFSFMKHPARHLTRLGTHTANFDVLENWNSSSIFSLEMNKFMLCHFFQVSPHQLWICEKARSLTKTAGIIREIAGGADVNSNPRSLLFLNGFKCLLKATFYYQIMAFISSHHARWKYRGKSGKWHRFRKKIQFSRGRTFWHQLRKNGKITQGGWYTHMCIVLIPKVPGEVIDGLKPPYFTCRPHVGIRQFSKLNYWFEEGEKTFFRKKNTSMHNNHHECNQ